MLNLTGLTFAQKLHAIKYGAAPDDPTPPPQPVDDLDRVMMLFDQYHETMPARDAYERATKETGRRYKSYQSFCVARAQYFRTRDRGARPPISKTAKRTTSTAEFIELFEPLAKKIGPQEAYRQLVAQTGKSWASYYTFFASRVKFYRRRDRFPPALPPKYSS